MNKQNIIKYTYLLLFISIIVFPSNCYADINSDTIESQRESFGISSFLKNAQNYTGTFFEDVEISELFNSAIKGKIDNKDMYKRVFDILGTETKTNLKSLISILAIIIIHSIFKAISDNLENNNISKLIYYVQYISIVTIIMVNFSNIITIVRETTNNLVGFINSLIPILFSLMLFTGSIATSSILEPIILFMVNFIGNLIQSILLPIVLLIASLSIVSKISDKVLIDKLSKFLKSSISWLLGLILTIFVGVVSLEGNLSSSVDGITAKTAKSFVSSAVPVVGKILGDAVDSVLGCGLILKNALGFVGVIIVIGICIVPLIKLSVLTVSYSLLASICEPIADKKIIKLLEQMGDIFKILLAILSAISVMIIIGTTLIIKISNSGMMYR